MSSIFASCVVAGDHECQMESLGRALVAVQREASVPSHSRQTGGLD